MDFSQLTKLAEQQDVVTLTHTQVRDLIDEIDKMSAPGFSDHIKKKYFSQVDRPTTNVTGLKLMDLD